MTRPNVIEFKNARQEELLNWVQTQMQSMPVACLLSDLQFHFLYWNPAAEKTFGYSSGEVKGKSLQDNIVPPSEAAALEKMKEGILRGDRQEPGKSLLRNLHKDGRVLLCEWYHCPLRDMQGNFIGLVSMAIDATYRHKSEEVQFHLAAILKQTTDAVIGADLEGNIFSWNHGAEAMYGYSLEEIIGRPVTLLSPPDHQVEMSKMLARALKGIVTNFEAVRIKKNGDLLEVSTTISPIKDFRGKAIGVSAISKDITERKRSEDAFRKNEEQMRLAQKMDAVGRLAGGVAHDFNNLLSVIGGNNDFLKASLPPGDARLEEVEEIKRSVQRGAELTKQLLAFGDKQVSQSQPVNLNALSTEMSRMFKRLISAAIHFSLIQDKNLKWIQSDPGQIQQAILNLVLNARDAMPEGGNLVVETKNIELFETRQILGLQIPPGSYVCLSVTDTGTGMNEETQKHIFEPFFTTKGDQGTGLGLATVYGIVHQWGGYLWVQSVPKAGTTFTLYFPAVEEKAAADAPSAPASGPTPGSETILVAEDEGPVRKIVVRALENHGYRVLQAGNGIEAIQQAWNYQDTIHLLLTDAVMPKMNGKELSDELKRARPQMVILFMSGYPREVLSQQGKIDPSIHLIQKPFSNDELAERVRKALDQAPAAAV